MLSNSVVFELKSLVSEGNLEQAFYVLKQHFPNLSDDLIALEGRFQQAKRDYDLGLIDYKEFSILSNQCINAFLSLLKGLQTNVPSIQETLKFSPHHQYTCDRNEQYNAFILLLNNSNRSRRHFFYIYGGEAQAHRGIFTRCVNRLKGIDLDHIHSNRKSGFEVINLSMTIPCLDDIHCLRTELPRMVLAEMGISDKDMEQMCEKSLALGLVKSPILSKFDATGKVFFHISITEAIWNARIVPGLTREFIQHFCLKDLPENAPELFFFFSVEYDDDNRKIRTEIETALKEADFVKNLGELQMVKDEHINRWFSDYKDFWETANARKQMKIKHFGEEAPDMFMDEVQLKLKKVINEINHDEKYGKRN